MRLESETTTIIKLELNEVEAKWLHDLMQNSSVEDEPEFCKKKREQLFTLLHKQLFTG